MRKGKIAADRDEELTERALDDLEDGIADLLVTVWLAKRKDEHGKRNIS